MEVLRLVLIVAVVYSRPIVLLTLWEQYTLRVVALGALRVVALLQAI